MNYTFYPTTNIWHPIFLFPYFFNVKKNDPLWVPNYQLLHTTQNV